MGMMRNMKSKDSDMIWRSGVMGVVIGDALGCPVQFKRREEVAGNPVTTMTGHGTYNMPVGTWTDDSSMTIALLSSIRDNRGIDLQDIMDRFACWMTEGEYTPFGESFDIGWGTSNAIFRYLKSHDTGTCGGRTEHDNGNGSLMRILPACLYCHEMQSSGKITAEEAVWLVHAVSGLTHNHRRAKIACGLYYFMIRRIRLGDGDLMQRLQDGIRDGISFYSADALWSVDLQYYSRLKDLSSFAMLESDLIRSSGYVVDTLEAAVWSLLKTDSFRDALLTAVNLGYDADTVGAITGGLAGLFYGYEDIPEEWLAVLQRRDWIESLCNMHGIEEL